MSTDAIQSTKLISTITMTQTIGVSRATEQAFGGLLLRRRVPLHLGVSLDDGCQIGVIAYALNGLTDHFLRMSLRFTTRSQGHTNLGRTSSPARNAAETTL